MIGGFLENVGVWMSSAVFPNDQGMGEPRTASSRTISHDSVVSCSSCWSLLLPFLSDLQITTYSLSQNNVKIESTHIRPSWSASVDGAGLSAQAGKTEPSLWPPLPSPSLRPHFLANLSPWEAPVEPVQGETSIPGRFRSSFSQHLWQSITLK